MTDLVILAVIDCLRPDHLGFAGYPRPTSPTLDEWAARGIVWEQAHSASSWTRPAVTSLLTGLYPAQHGVLSGIRHRDGRARSFCESYAGAHPTLAERFRTAGWRCAAFIHNAQLGPFSGMDRGFDEYWWDKGDAPVILDALERWLAAEPGRPAFVYLHFLEVHWPYRPRRRHVQLFGGDRDTNPFYPLAGPDFGKLRRSVERHEMTLAPSDVEQIVQLYDAMIRRLDKQIHELEALLERLQRLRRAALVVTADHGDEFYDHAMIGHGHSLYEELTHVPLLARLPDGPAGLRISRPVSVVDLADTLLQCGHIRDAWTQTSLLEPNSVPRPVVSELRTKHRYVQAIQCASWKLHRRFRLADAEPPDVRQYSPADWRKSAQEIQHELYDLSADPHEQTNRRDDAACRERCMALELELDRWWDSCRSGQPAALRQLVEVDERIVSRLRDLGYME